MRLLNRFLVFALGVVLAAIGFVIAVECVWTGLGYRFLWFPGRAWLHALRTSAWVDRPVQVGGAVAATVGLILLVAELRPWPKRLAQVSTQENETWLVHRHSTEQYLRRTVQKEIPTSPVKAELSIGRRRWDLRLRLRAAASIKPELRAVAQQELERLGAPQASRVVVRTSRPPRVS